MHNVAFRILAELNLAENGEGMLSSAHSWTAMAHCAGRGLIKSKSNCATPYEDRIWIMTGWGREILGRMMVENNQNLKEGQGNG